MEQQTMVIFYLTNYFAHAATIISSPGQGTREMIATIFIALLLPGSGVLRALNTIYRHSIFAGDPIQQAIRAGALCMVVKKPNPDHPPNRPARNNQGRDTPLPDQLPQDGDIRDIELGIVQSNPRSIHPDSSNEEEEEEVTNSIPQRQWWQTPNPRYLSPDTIVHGEHRLPSNYVLAFVPPYARIELIPPRKSSKEIFLSSYNILKLLVSLLQALWATVTLYRTRGDQIQQYGYAAFGLTVAPYAFMSIMNIIGALLNAEYPAIFLVRTPSMDDAEREPGSDFFATEVCFRALEPPCAETPGGLLEFFRRALDPDIKDELTALTAGSGQNAIMAIAGKLLGSVPLANVGGLSKFQAKDSTSIQGGFTVSWLIVGIFYGASVKPQIILKSPTREIQIDDVFASVLSFFLVFGVAPIGGMVMVGLMIQEFGICTLLD
ncbi:hypothetical protein VN97_g3244 [Penicillium thymicola]|uniref:Uncharacterized protein n=1 Tax=Penicillium thymicola TaxID=293382 RepID=A0AAI9TMT6_PENTH|nr:hypothetical protein VN97_g3244 [Penicillium thymicola]